MIEYCPVVTTDDYYELLGVSRDAADQEIKSAFKRAARKYHPDNNETGNEELFKKVNEAYEVLRDPQKRTIYDQYGADGLKGGGSGFGGFSGFGGAGAAGFEDLSEIFSSFFGEGAAEGFGFGGRGRSRAQAPRKGQDHRVDVTLDFLEPVEKLSKKIQLNPLVDCSSCDGKGAETSSDIVSCSTCQGTGQVTSVQNTILGQIRQSHTCPSCKGSGKEIKNPCKKCKGKGQRREDKEVEVSIPAGVFDGAQIRLGGLGDAGKNGGPPGDIYLVVHVKDHSKFHREDENIYTQIEIGMAEAALGIEIEIPTIRGSSKLKIKSGTQSGEVLTLKGEGMPKLNNPARNGDHYVNIVVNTPKNPSGNERKLLEELQELREGKDNKIS